MQVINILKDSYYVATTILSPSQLWSHRIETSQLIWSVDELTGFYVIRTLVVDGLKLFWYQCNKLPKKYCASWRCSEKKDVITGVFLNFSWHFSNSKWHLQIRKHYWSFVRGWQLCITFYRETANSSVFHYLSHIHTLI